MESYLSVGFVVEIPIGSMVRSRRFLVIYRCYVTESGFCSVVYRRLVVSGREVVNTGI